MDRLELLKTAIESGKYKKIELSKLVGCSVPTLDDLLNAHPDIEKKRDALRPKVAEKGRRKYLSDYHKSYKRPERKDYFKSYNKSRNPKNTEGVTA